MKIVCIGGGAAGLYFSILMKKQDPTHEITVIERNRPYDTFGWGVVFSDATLSNFVRADEPTARTILQSFNHWDDIDVRIKGKSMISGGHGFCGIGRKRLLNILQERCEELGVKLVFETDVKDDQEIAAEYGADLIIASDGLNSAIRTRYADTFKPDIDTRVCKFVWLGTKKIFKDFTFIFEETEFGWFQAHVYQFDGDTSTFIIETPEDVWRAAGLEDMSQEDAIAFCEKLFAKDLEGAKLMSNATHLRGSANWIKFPRVICENWTQWNTINGKEVPVVLMGDSAHTAHFSIGSGTKLAMEDAIDLAKFMSEAGTRTMPEILADYQAIRGVEVIKIQSAAKNAMEWFENAAQYTHMEPEQFNYSLLTRSQRISHDNLKIRDAKFVEDYEKWFATKAFADAGIPLPKSGAHIPPMFTPFKVRDVVLQNRIVVSPMAQYSCVDGLADGADGELRAGPAEEEAEGAAEQAEDRGLGEPGASDGALLDAERAEDGDFAAATNHRAVEGLENQIQADEERDEGQDGEIEAEGARHPVVEASLEAQGKAFAANDCDLSAERAGRIAVVTGPNMAGKSTFLRQNALIVLLAQAGMEAVQIDAVVDRVHPSGWQAGGEKQAGEFATACDDGTRARQAIEDDFGGPAPAGRFEVTPTTRPDGGGGLMSVMRGGRVFEKIGVNVSAVHGTLAERAQKSMAARGVPGMDKDPRFWASGISLVAHMQNPHAPAIHLNTRMFWTPHAAWFGGGTDLNPCIEYAADTQHFHATLQAACDGHSPDYYQRFKAWADCARWSTARRVSGRSLVLSRVSHGLL